VVTMRCFDATDTRLTRLDNGMCEIVIHARRFTVCYRIPLVQSELSISKFNWPTRRKSDRVAVL